MKLANEYKKLLEAKQKIKYDMLHINGGFSNGVEIVTGQTSNIMNISVDIYGGGKSMAHSHQVPPTIQELQESFIAARTTGDPVARDIKLKLETYFANVRRAISWEIVSLLKELDQKSSTVIAAAVQRVNNAYTNGTTQQQAPQVPQQAPATPEAPARPTAPPNTKVPSRASNQPTRRAPTQPRR